MFTPIWGRFPFWLIFFKGVEATNQFRLVEILSMSRKKTSHLCGPWLCGKKTKIHVSVIRIFMYGNVSSGDSPTKKVTCRFFLLTHYHLGPWVCMYLILCLLQLVCVYHHLGRCLFDLPEKHMRWPAGSEEKRTHAIPRLYGRGFFLASFGNFGFDFLVYQSITYILTDSTHLFTNKRLIHVSVLIFPLTSLCVPVSLFKPAETSLFRRFILCLFSSSAPVNTFLSWLLREQYTWMISDDQEIKLPL